MDPTDPNLRVALVHYWLVNMRGGEKVLEALCELFPQAVIYTHVYDPGAVSETIRRHRVVTTSIQRLPFARRLYQKYLMWMPQALEQLDRVGLADRAFQRADTLSGGQQQRVAIARTIMQKPRIVLADEPVASLDPEISGQVMDVLFRVCSEENLSVLCSLHQVDLALGWAKRLIGLRDGQLVLDKPAEGLTTADAMAVYQRLDPTGEKIAEYEMPELAGRMAR